MIFLKHFHMNWVILPSLWMLKVYTLIHLGPTHRPVKTDVGLIALNILT